MISGRSCAYCRRMEWTAVTGLIASALGGGALVKIWEQHRQRQDKLEERRVQHDERLRQAHAQLIASYRKLLAVCEELHEASMIKLNHEDPDAAPDPNDLSPDEYRQLCEDHRQLTKAFSVAAVETDARIVETLLLDRRSEIQVRLHSLLKKPLPRRIVYMDDFEATIAFHRDELDAFTRLLAAKDLPPGT
jgi:hypothetical protein